MSSFAEMNWFEDEVMEAAAGLLVTLVWIAGLFLLAFLLRRLKSLRGPGRDDRPKGVGE